VYHKIWPKEDEGLRTSPSFGEFSCNLIPYNDGKSLPFRVVEISDPNVSQSHRRELESPEGEDLGSDSDSFHLEINTPKPAENSNDPRSLQDGSKPVLEDDAKSSQAVENQTTFAMEPNDEGLFRFDEEVVQERHQPQPRPMPQVINEHTGRDEDARGPDEDAKAPKFVPPHTLVENKFWSFAPDLKFPKTARAVRASRSLKKEGNTGKITMTSFEKIPLATRNPPATSMLSKSFQQSGLHLKNRIDARTNKMPT